MDSTPKNFSEYLEITSRLRIEASENKNVCIKNGISLLLYAGFFILFFCSIEIGTWAEKLRNTAFVFGIISAVVWFFRRHWSTITQLGLLGMVFYIARKLFSYFLVILVFGLILCVVIDHFFSIPTWVIAPETRRIAIYVISNLITAITFILLIYRLVISCLYQKALKNRLDSLTSWYETHSLDLIDAENQKHHT